MSDQSTADRDLWCAVVRQAFNDALSADVSKAAALHRQQARTWLTRYSADFAEVCALAGLEAEAVRDKAVAMIAAAPAKPIPGRKGTVAQLTDAQGVTLPIAEWSRRLGIPDQTIRNRIRHGWTAARALEVRQPKVKPHA